MRRFGGAFLCVLLLSGCYTLVPVAGQPTPLGTNIAVDINDAGRVALGGSMGPAIDQIEGRLVQKDSAEYVLAVAVVRFLRGGEQSWTGERVRIKSEYVTAVRQKQFSRGRTAILASAALGVVAIFVSRSIIGSGTGDPVRPPVDSTSQKNRIPRR